MRDVLRLYIHESSAEQCTAKGMHRSGARVRPISFNDVLYGSDNETPIGIVSSVVPERIDRENWLYRVTYVPQAGTLHPIDSFVLWRQPCDLPVPVVPAVEQRIEQTAPVRNGRKRTKKQSVNGQHGNGAQASAPLATATV